MDLSRLLHEFISVTWISKIVHHLVPNQTKLKFYQDCEAFECFWFCCWTDSHGSKISSNLDFCRYFRPMEKRPPGGPTWRMCIYLLLKLTSAKHNLLLVLLDEPDINCPYYNIQCLQMWSKHKDANILRNKMNKKTVLTSNVRWWPNLGQGGSMNFPNGPIDVCEHIEPLLQTHLRERTCSQLAIQSSKPNFNFLPPNDVNKVKSMLFPFL